MADLKSNLASLAEKRAATAARRKLTQASLSEFLAERVKTTPAPTSPYPVGGAAVQRRLAAGNDASGGTSPGTLNAGFDPNFESALGKLIKDSGGRLSIKSGYRSPERQAQLYAAAVKKYGSEAAARKWVAPPGKSNHNRGLAADLGFSNAEAIAWAHQNAGRYGLVFPLSNENWHIEPVNARHK